MACQHQTGRKHFLNSLGVRFQPHAVSVDAQTLADPELTFVVSAIHSNMEGGKLWWFTISLRPTN